MVDALAQWAPIQSMWTPKACFNSSKCLESLPGIGIVAWKSGLPVHTIFGVLDVGAYAAGMPTIPNGLLGLAPMPGRPPNGLALSDHVRAEQVELDFPIARGMMT